MSVSWQNWMRGDIVELDVVQIYRTRPDPTYILENLSVFFPVSGGALAEIEFGAF